MPPRFNFDYEKCKTDPSEAFPRRVTALRPIIRVKVSNKLDPSKNLKTTALVDSGADICVFDAQIGEQIGLNIESGKLLVINGVADKPVKAYFHDIILTVAGYDLPRYVGFSREMRSSVSGILGQVGFFDSYKITFNYKKEKIEFSF